MWFPFRYSLKVFTKHSNIYSLSSPTKSFREGAKNHWNKTPEWMFMWVWMVMITKRPHGQLSQSVLLAVGGMVPTWSCWVSDPLTGNGLRNGHLYNLIWITNRVMNMGFARNKTKQVIQLRWHRKSIAFLDHLQQMYNYKSLVKNCKMKSLPYSGLSLVTLAYKTSILRFW